MAPAARAAAAELPFTQVHRPLQRTVASAAGRLAKTHTLNGKLCAWHAWFLGLQMQRHPARSVNGKRLHTVLGLQSQLSPRARVFSM